MAGKKSEKSEKKVSKEDKAKVVAQARRRYLASAKFPKGSPKA